MTSLRLKANGIEFEAPRAHSVGPRANPPAQFVWLAFPLLVVATALLVYLLEVEFSRIQQQIDHHALSIIDLFDLALDKANIFDFVYNRVADAAKLAALVVLKRLVRAVLMVGCLFERAREVVEL